MAKILIIDDRVANRDLLVTLLGYGGHHLVEASDGLEGLQICLSEKPDLVITDILMPTMDGYEFVRRLRLDPEIAETKILFYTAHYHLEEAINLAKSCGVLEVLKKPCEPEELLRAVASALNLDSALPSITLQPDFDENHLRLLTNKLSRNVDELRKTNQRLEILVQLGVELGSEKDASRLLQTFCDSSREIVGARFAVVGIPSGEGAYYRHFFTSGMDQATSKKLNRNEALTGALASVISTGRCFRAARDSGFHNLGLPASFPAAKSILVVALLSPLRIYGWICLLEKLGADTFSEEDERLIKMLATQVGRTYENGSLYMHLLDHSAKLAEEITERKRVEAALRDSAARLREAQQIARVGNWSWEPHTQSTLWSEVLFDLFALDPQSTKPSFEKFLSVLHPEDRETAQNRVKAVLSGQDGFADDLRILQPNSQILWIHSRACARRDAQGQLILLEGTDQDITERKRAEVNLQRTVFLLKAVADSTTDAVFVKDKEGKYLLFNQAAADFVGKSIDEVIGQDDSILFDAQSFSQIRARELRVMETGRVETQEEILTAAGKTRIYNALKAPFWDENGKVIGVIGISRDVTDQRQLEDQLRQAQKMEAVGRLAGGIAHDFNNLLTVINGYGELVLSLLKANDPAREMIQEIVGAGERASSLTRQLLAFSRKSIVEPKIVDPVSLVTDLDKLLRRVVGEDIELSVMSSGNVGVIQIDPGQFEQVIMNMVVNARDAMPKGGFVTIELQNINLDESYIGKHPDAIYGPHVLIAITDSGIGMDAVTQSRIFEPFFTTKGEHGTGLGLATAHGIIKQAGGQVSVYSELGKGTTFKIYLPRIDSPAQTIKKDSKPISQGSESILLVEDEEMVRSLSKHILISLGYRVTEATNGEEALALVEKPGSSFRLLITDVVMPKIGGRELANQLKQKFPDLKVLFLSGYTDDAVVRHGILQAEVAFLQKPFTPALLAAKVRETLDSTQTG